MECLVSDSCSTRRRGAASVRANHQLGQSFHRAVDLDFLTTLLRALVTATEIASSLPLSAVSSIGTFVPFMSEKAKGQPTRICVDFEADGLLLDKSPQLFRYEVIVERGESSAIEFATLRCEALFHFPKGRPRRLIERAEPGRPIYVSREFGLRARDDRLKGIRADATRTSSGHSSVSQVPRGSTRRHSSVRLTTDASWQTRPAPDDHLHRLRGEERTRLRTVALRHLPGSGSAPAPRRQAGEWRRFGFRCSGSRALSTETS